MHAAGIALAVLRSEGLRAFRDRVADRLDERRRRRAFGPPLRELPAGGPLDGFAAPVLNLLATPPAPRLGGVQAQLLHRLTAEERSRSVALLYPEEGEGRGYRLELTSGSRRRAFTLPGAAPSSDGADFAQMVARAAAAVGATAVHVEGLAGLPLRSLLALANGGLRLILSLHDFAAFCSRPHLLERTEPPRFCDYSRDLDRCARCLGTAETGGAAVQAERRAVAAELLAAAAALIFPSPFLRRTYGALFPGLPAERQRVIEPAGGDAVLPELVAGRTHERPVRHVAFVGSVLPHKGALVFLEVLRRLATGGDALASRLHFSVYGGGDPALLDRLRRSPAAPRVRGYYRSGSLPRRLRQDRVDLALLLSIVPESFGLTLDECMAAGVPALAFDQGALGERIARSGGGLLVPLDGEDGGAAAVESRLRALADGTLRLPASAVPPRGSAERAAREWLDLYAELAGC